MPLATNMPDLSQLMGPFGGFAMGQQKDMAMANNKINQDAELFDIYSKQQHLPVDLAAKEATTGLTKETTRGAAFKNDMNDATKDQTYAAHISKLAAETNENELKAAEASLNNLALQTRDPATLDTINVLRGNMRDIWAERTKQKDLADRQEAIERIRTGSAEKIAQMNIDAGRWNKSSKAVLTLEQAIDNSKSARERHQKLIDAATLAEQGGDKEAAAHYRARAEAVRPQAEAELQAQPKPNTPNLNSLGVPTNPNPSIAPGGSTPNQYKAPKTQQEYDALPSGTIYVDTDGKTKRKK